MINWLIDKWHARQRAIDMEILWPICVDEAEDIDHAKAAFAVHAFNDAAWLSLGRENVCRFIEDLRGF